LPEARNEVILGVVLQAMNAQELEIELTHFHGTQHYYLISSNLVLTDGVKYLADTANCYWLVTAIQSHLPKCFAISEFCLAKLSVKEQKANLVITDGNDHVLAEQQFDYTDFPMESISIYITKSHPYSVMLLPSEY